MKKVRVSAWLCFAAAGLCVAAALWHAYRIVSPAVLWNATQAKVEGARLRYKHDGEAMLLYYIYARLTYQAAGQQVSAEAGSDFHTYEFHRARSLAQSIAATREVSAYWNPANPKEVRFALAYNDLLGPPVAGSAAAAFGLVLSGLWLRRNWLPPVRCARCSMPLKRYFRYCPYCQTVLQQAAGARAT